MVFTDGRRVTKLRTREIVADSKDYLRGSAAIETTLEKGKYTIICSTFEKGQYAKFTLSLHTSIEVTPALEPLPPEGSGRLSIVSEPAVFSPDSGSFILSSEELGFEAMLACVTWDLSRANRTSSSH